MEQLSTLLAAYAYAIGFSLAVYAAGFALERARPAESIDWHSLAFNLQTLLVFQMVATVLAFVVQPAVQQAATRYVPGLVGLIKLRDLGGASAAWLVLYLCAFDFFYYWLHRAQHAIPWLWSIHRLHHTETHLNVTTTLRVHWLEEVCKLPAIALPMMVLFDGPPAAVGIFVGALRYWLYFIHLNARVSFGPLSWVMTNPAVHRIHHSIEERDRDRNFAALFPIWDVLFRTWNPPRRGEWPRTGVEGVVESGVLNAMVAPLPLMLAARRRRIGSASL
jgi:sterol desaturase/sphingolipid hydroxylase (fatty acid hydroxylase superfamily)